MSVEAARELSAPDVGQIRKLCRGQSCFGRCRWQEATVRDRSRSSYRFFERTQVSQVMLGGDRDMRTTKTHLIWELMPYRACSSGANSSGRILADRSLCMPDCLLRRKVDMLPVICHY